MAFVQALGILLVVLGVLWIAWELILGNPDDLFKEK